MPESNAVRRWSAVLQVLATVAMALLAVTVALALLVFDLPQALREAAGLEPGAQIVPATRFAAAAVGAVPVLATIYALGHMSALFGLYAKGETLTPPCARHIRRIGAGLLAVAALQFLTRPAQVALVSLANPPGERVLAISLGSADWALVLAGGLLLTIGWVMGEAARIAEDHQAIV
ncbi:MAG: DUF2975 domain-containing protein [Rhodobacter sp.]|nr:DUF2975 domain-containing protein [Rhodobacter sp.]